MVQKGRVAAVKAATLPVVNPEASDPVESDFREVLQCVHHLFQKTCGRSPVDDTVIVREAQINNRRDSHVSLVDHNLFAHCTNTQQCPLGRIEHGREVGDSHISHVADSYRRVAQLFILQCVIFGALR